MSRQITALTEDMEELRSEKKCCWSSSINPTMDTAELGNARTALRQEKKQNAIERLKTAYGKQYDYSRMQRADKDVAAMLGEEAPVLKRQSVRRQLRKAHKQQEPRQRKPKERGQER